GADIVNHIHCQALLIEQAKILSISAPGDLEGGTFDILRGSAIVLWCRRFTFTNHHRSDALTELAFRTDGIKEKGKAAATHHVDEAWRDHGAASVDGALCSASRERADIGDPAIANADIRNEPRVAGAVDDASAGDENVERSCGIGRLRAGGSSKNQGE